MGQVSGSEQRLAELSLLYNLGKSFSAILDLSELLTQIVDAAITLAHASGGMILLPDDDAEQLTTRAMRGVGDPKAHVLMQPSDDPLAHHVMAHGEPVLINPGDSPDALEGFDTDITSLVYVPLIAKGKTIGVLGVLNKVDQEGFTRRDQDMLAGLAGYAAIAIENARLYQQALDRTRELRLLVESANAVSSSLDLGRVLDAIARHMMRALDTHWCIISTWDAENNQTYRLAEARSAIWPPEERMRIALEDYPAYQYLLSTGRPLAISQPDDTSDFPCLSERTCKRLLTLPLQTSGQMVGLAQLIGLGEERPLTPGEIGQSQRIALAVASLLRQPDSEAWRKRIRQAARLLLDTASADWCTFFIWEPEGNTLARLMEYGTAIWDTPEEPELTLSRLPTLRIVLNEQRVTVLRSTDQNLPPFERLLFEPIGPSAQLILPLVFKARTVGLVRLYDINPARRFTSREMALASTMASQAAIALENARLVHDLQRSLEEQREMQSHLVRIARFSALGELSAVIAHQINNPLTTILADAEMLTQDIPPDDPSYESAQAIQRAGLRAKRVVEQVLNMARYEEQVRPLDVNQTIRETIEVVGPLIAQNRITLEVDLDPDIPPVAAIPGQLEDVWMNLLINARDAIPPDHTNGLIAIRSRSLDSRGMIEVRVEDNGQGILPEHLDRIFDPHFTTKPRGTGTGLGLYICRQIVADHKGEIKIDSTPGKGTHVVVRLPATFELSAEEAYGPYSDRR